MVERVEIYPLDQNGKMMSLQSIFGHSKLGPNANVIPSNKRWNSSIKLFGFSLGLKDLLHHHLREDNLYVRLFL